MEQIEEIKHLLSDCQLKMEKSILSLEKELSKIRSGRANTAILDSIRIEYYGSTLPINQLGNVAVVDANLITISPWEKKMLPELEKAILKSGLGITPQNDGNIIRLPIQPLTEERRKEIIKLIHKISEDYKNSIRTSRRENNNSLKNLEKQKLISKDDLERAITDLQKIVDQQSKKIDTIIAQKETELAQI